jgi:hypothetical protein
MIVFCNDDQDGIMLSRFIGPGTFGFAENPEKSGLANGDVKNDGALVPVVFVGEICEYCADAESAEAKKSNSPNIHPRARIAHLPRFENRAYVAFEELGE